MIAAPRAGSVERIGFVHFVEEHLNPGSALTKAIEKERIHHEDISNSLIVLPEAFNSGTYNSASELQPAQEILEKLRCELAGPLRIAFVVGLLDPYRRCLGPDGRRNSAYWVDANGPQLMCHKMGNDSKDHLYDPCLRNPDRSNPIACANARVGALICMDATQSTDNSGSRLQQRRNNLLTHMKGGEGHKIVCVPARFSVPTNPDPFEFLSVIPDYWYVVADGYHLGTSFIARARVERPKSFPAARFVEPAAHGETK